MHLNDAADEVVMVYKEGKIEKGHHNELIKNPESKYYDMWSDYLNDRSEDIFE